MLLIKKSRYKCELGCVFHSFEPSWLIVKITPWIIKFLLFVWFQQRTINIMFIYFLINFLLTDFRVSWSPCEFFSPYGKKTKRGIEKIFNFHWDFNSECKPRLHHGSNHDETWLAIRRCYKDAFRIHFKSIERSCIIIYKALLGLKNKELLRNTLV